MPVVLENLGKRFGDGAPVLDDVNATIEKAMQIDDVPVVVDFRVHRDAMVWPMVAAGTSNDDIKFARDMAPDFEDDDMESRNA